MYGVPAVCVERLAWESIPQFFVALVNHPVRGEYDAGEAGLFPPSRLGQMSWMLPRDAPVSLVESTTGRPVFKSTRVAQFSVVKGAATSTSPVPRSSV